MSAALATTTGTLQDERFYTVGDSGPLAIADAALPVHQTIVAELVWPWR
jgi:hypothetical protein